jgi:Ca2+-binding RTX toxin-like protein
MKKNWRWMLTTLVLGMAGAAGMIVLTASTAANTVPVTRVDEDSKGTSADALKPPECSGIALDNIVDIGAGETGTSANNLILGTDKADAQILGGAGDDCILGGKGNERQRIGGVWVPGLYGEDGNDVLIGGPGSSDYCAGGDGDDTYYSCEFCAGGPGNDTYYNCDTIY